LTPNPESQIENFTMRLSRRPCYGIIPSTYRHTKEETGRIITILGAKLTEYRGDEDLANSECWL